MCPEFLCQSNFVSESYIFFFFFFQLKLWDIRARACVQDYRGHVNEITHGLRFYVDPTDSLIFAGKLDHFLIALISEKDMTCMK